jgi:MFS family permease
MRNDGSWGVTQAKARAGMKAWWFQFPAPLRALARIRSIAMLGAGGVLYLTPLVFHREAFSASSVGDGLALAALAGVVGRLLSGVLLDRGRRASLPVVLAASCALLGDASLFSAEGFGGYVLGQLLLGLAAGLYWPAIELAVPLCCGTLPSARGFALVRSADAFGVVCGALIGALLAALGWLRGIYLVDIACVLTMLALVLRRPLPASPRDVTSHAEEPPTLGWLVPLLPLLAVTVIATAVPALMQGALPLDLVRGGLQRPPLPEALGALTMGLQLGLLLLLQWPVGQALARRPVGTGLSLSLICFVVGGVLLALSALTPHGLALLLLAQLPVALGQAAFLPTATEAVVELSPLHRQGVAMALFSQCFAISAFTAPLVAGRLLDGQRHGVGLWLGMSLLSLLSLAVVPQLERFQRRNLLQVLAGSGERGQGGVRRILYRLPLRPGAGGSGPLDGLAGEEDQSRQPPEESPPP